MGARTDALAGPAAAEAPGHGPSLRLDKFLWFARLAPNRASAQKLAERGIVRLNGRRIDRAHAPVRVGDQLTVPQGRHVHVIRVEQLPQRRGPAVEAQACYSALAPGEKAALGGQ